MPYTTKHIYDGNRAKEVLDNEAFQNAFDEIKQELKTAWEQSPARDCEGREKIWLTLCMANKLEQALKSMMVSGNNAAKELEYLRNKSIRERVVSAIF